MRLFSILLITIALIQPAQAWSLFGPKNYDQCILKNTKGVADGTALALIMLACSNEFPSKAATNTCKKRALTSAEQSALTINAQNTDTSLVVNIHNGNAKIEIAEVTIEIGADNIKPLQRYTLSLQPIGPLLAGQGYATLVVAPVGARSIRLSTATTCQ